MALICRVGRSFAATHQIKKYSVYPFLYTIPVVIAFNPFLYTIPVVIAFISHPQTPQTPPKSKDDENEISRFSA
jgi:hypothetical protein